MPGTRSHYLRHATLFLKAVFSTAPFDVTKVTPQAITDFVRGQAAKLKPSSCAAPATSMRVFLRFLITYHGLPAGVVGAVPTIRQWKLASLPKHLSVEEVDRTLATCDEQSPVGKRDRAILMLLVRLALRAGEVGRLRLSESSWREGGVQPSSETATEKPLPTDVVRLLQNTCRTVVPRALNLSSSYALAHRLARSTAPLQ
jgi:integrase